MKLPDRPVFFPEPGEPRRECYRGANLTKEIKSFQAVFVNEMVGTRGWIERSLADVETHRAAERSVHLVVLSPFACGRIKDAFAKTERLGGRFHELIRADVLDRAFEGHLKRRFELDA